MIHRTLVACGIAMSGVVAISAQQTTPAETPVGNEFHIYYTQGDQVVRIAQRWSSVPGAPGSFYETFDLDQNARRAATTPARKIPSAGCTATPEQLAENTRIAAGFWRTGITPPERIALVDEGYVQHNPFLHRYALENRVTDYQTLTVFATRAGAQLAPQSITTAAGQTLTPQRVARSIAACDVVTQLHKRYSERPEGSGNWVEVYDWDTFRVRNGKLVEHWDGTSLPSPQPAAAPAPRN